MSSTRYNLVFEGKAEPGAELDEVRQTLEDMFEFDRETQAALFSGQLVVLGESMDQATAETFRQALSGVGVATRLAAVQTAPAGGTMTDMRSNMRRLVGVRRARVRAEAIQPDRRTVRERRS